jgi:hypothetical protein
MATSARAVIEIELDNQYTMLVFKQVDEGGDILQSTTPNLTLAQAFDQAKSELAAMIGGGEKCRRATINVRIA